MPRSRVSSPTNPHVKHWHRLGRNAGYRAGQGEVWVEGMRFIETAQQAGIPVKTLIVLEGEDPGLAGYSGDVVEVSSKVMKKCGTTASAPRTAAVLEADVAIASVLPAKGRYIVLCGIQDPGNMGSVARSVHGAGWDGIVLVGECTDPYSPKAIRASAGSVFPIGIYRSDEAGLKAWVESGASLVGASSHEGGSDFSGFGDVLAGGLLIGSEGAGLPESAARLCKSFVRIPLAEGCESLNAAVAENCVDPARHQARLKVTPREQDHADGCRS